jgi:hypothetical protein
MLPLSHHHSSSSSVSSSSAVGSGCFCAGLLRVAGRPNGSSRLGGGGPTSSFDDDEGTGPDDFSRARDADEAGATALGPSSSSVSSSEVRSGVAAPGPDSSSCSSAFASSTSIWSASDPCSGSGSGSTAFAVALRLDERDAAAFRGLVSSLAAFTVDATPPGQPWLCV